MILYLLHKTPLKHIYFRYAGKRWVKKKIEPFLPYLNKGDKILDVGSGNGLISWELRKMGFEVVPLDIKSQAFEKSVAPVVYDGHNMPFNEKEFDVALILSVLHHTTNQEEILNEVKRVSKRIIINEDIYGNSFQKKMTFLIDSFVNIGYAPCPHTNRNDQEWKDLFKSLNCQILSSNYLKVLAYFKQGIYHIKVN